MEQNETPAAWSEETTLLLHQAKAQLKAQIRDLLKDFNSKFPGVNPVVRTETRYETFEDGKRRAIGTVVEVDVFI